MKENICQVAAKEEFTLHELNIIRSSGFLFVGGWVMHTDDDAQQTPSTRLLGSWANVYTKPMNIFTDFS